MSTGDVIADVRSSVEELDHAIDIALELELLPRVPVRHQRLHEEIAALRDELHLAFDCSSPLH